ncbi:MAG: tetratricopeptide repeat protein [Bacteriovoracaceae bacterium]|jgi:hypothetical protein|nr:tetratricopeptide repeat protein [Bacteriovoracaceae bacterium]
MQYKVVNDDIVLIENTKTKDLMVRLRLFELYTEKHKLIDRREKELEIFGARGSIKKIRKLKQIKKSVLTKIEKLSSKIINYIKDRDVLAKLYYFKALSYYIEKKKKLFYKNIKKAESYASNIRYRRQIYTRLADHHYNDKRFAPAKKYYEKLLKLPHDVWLKKHLFNLAWIYLKLEKFSKAINTLKRIYNLNNNKKYHELGAQLDKTIILFYARSSQVNPGLKFLRVNNLNSFKNLLLFLRYNSENGNKKKTPLILNELERIDKTITEKTILLSKSITLLRADHQYNKIHKKIISFNKQNTKFKQIEIDELKNLIENVKGYTGFLQVSLKSKGMNSKSKRVNLLKYIIYNFNMLSVLDPSKSLEYNYLKGESALAIKKYRLALHFYKKSIMIYSKRKNKNIKIITPIYDSLYFCLERIEKDKSYIENLIWGYKSYLKFQPRGKLSNIIYQNYINLHFEQNKINDIPKILKTYNKYYPTQLLLQKKYYLKMVNTLVKDKGVKHLSSLRKMLRRGFLGYGVKEVKNLTLIINELYFKKFDDMNKIGNFKGALKGFNSIVMNKKHDYSLRIDSLINVLKINHDHRMWISLSDNIGFFLQFAKKKVLEKNKEKIKYYVSLFCSKNLEKSCYKYTLFLNENFKQAMDNFLIEQLLKLSLFNSKYNYAIKLLKENRQHTAFVKQTILLTGQTKMLDIIKEIKDPRFLSELRPTLKHIAWTNAFASRDLSIFKKFKSNASGIKILEPVIKNIFYQYKYLKKQLQPIPVLKVPTPLSFDVFSRYLSLLLAENKRVNDKIDQMMKGANPYLTFSMLSYIVRYYHNLISYTKSFKANTSEKNLNVAIENEIKKFSNLYLSKIKDFETLKNQLMIRINDKAGAAKLYHDHSHGLFNTDSFKRSLLWK